MVKIKVNCLNLDETLDCGQCFRWEKEEEKYIGVIKDRVVELKIQNNILLVESNKEENLENVIKEYLDLNVDYAKIENEISNIDNTIKKCVKESSGIHFLKQDKFETIISFIISANNNIPRIKKSIEKISTRYGEKVEYKGKIYYLFPTIKQLSGATKEELRELGVGFRDKYIVDTTKMLLNKEVNLDVLDNLNTIELKKELMKLKGVGSKVADCIMLFSFSRKECFPVDVWIKRVMQNLYYDGMEVDNKKILEDALKRYGSYAGIVQQHLFQNGRKGNI